MNKHHDKFLAPWSEWAREYGCSQRATFRDQLQFDLEVTTLYNCLATEGERVLDIGCGNGATLRRLLDLGLRPDSMCGCDLLDEFVTLAKDAVPSAEFFLMDISSDDTAGWEKIKSFQPTAVIQKRVLCNLSGRISQRKTLMRLCECLPDGCKILLIEPMLDGLQRLNILRGIFGLDLLKEPPFNEYLRWEDIQFCLESASVAGVTKLDYTGTYYIGSRVLQPFLWPDVEPTYDHPINEYFMKHLPNREGFGLHWLIQGTKAGNIVGRQR